MYNDIISNYSKNPLNKGDLLNPTIVYWEENSLCGDDLKVFLVIENNIIKDWSFTGDLAIITIACASIFGEKIIGMQLKDVLELGYKYITELIEDEVSDRRKKASILGILTTRNAIHKFLDDGKTDTFEDLISN